MDPALPAPTQVALSTTEVVSSEWLKVQRDLVVDDRGTEASYWILRREPFILVIPRSIADGQVCLVRRYRYPVKLWFWEFPQARISPHGLDAIEGAAARQILELAGGQVTDVEFELIGRFYEAYGYSDHQCYCVVADVGPSCVESIDRSPMTTRWLAPEHLAHSLVELRIADSATIASLTLLSSLSSREGPSPGD